MKVELRAVKVYKGMSEETTAFNAQVWIDGKRVCEASNHGQGGPNEYHPHDHKKWAEFEAWARALPPLPPGPEDWAQKLGPLPMDADLYIGDLLFKHEDAQFFKRHCKTKTLFRLTGDGPETYRTIKAPYTPAVKQHLVSKYGDKLTSIINEEIAS